jgi:predicted RNA binding protein YcfA (HicA-like mRNA interferase family)
VFYGIVLRCLERFASWFPTWNRLVSDLEQAGFRLGTGWFPTWNRLVSDLEQAGFRQAQGGKGSHRKFRHPSLRGSILLGGAAADDAKYYQEKQIRNAIGKLTK